MEQPTPKKNREETRRIATLLGTIFFIGALLYGWLLWRQYQYVMAGRHYRQEFTQQEIEVLEKALQINMTPDYTIYNAMYDFDSVCVELYTKEASCPEEVWHDLFGIDMAELNPSPYVKSQEYYEEWETLEGETVSAITFNPDFYRDSDMYSFYIHYYLWEKDNGYCIAADKHALFEYEDELVEMFIDSKE